MYIHLLILSRKYGKKFYRDSVGIIFLYSLSRTSRFRVEYVITEPIRSWGPVGGCLNLGVPPSATRDI